MSRIGKKPIDIPAKVEVKQKGLNIAVKGPNGELDLDHHPDMTVKIEDNQIVVERPTDLRHHRSLHGLTRSLINNMVVGVSEGFTKTLEIEGVGYQAELQGQNLNMKLGFSHPVIIEPPDGITFEVPKEDRGRVIHISGPNKESVGQIAAEIRGLRPPEPYKGKGVRYRGERIIRKAGKAGKK
jgi:large subunit ribosomal protein L6